MQIVASIMLFIILFGVITVSYINNIYKTENNIQYINNSHIENFFPYKILNDSSSIILFKTGYYKSGDFDKNNEIIYYLTGNSLSGIGGEGWTGNFYEIQKIRERINEVCYKYNKKQFVPFCIKKNF